MQVETATPGILPKEGVGSFPTVAFSGSDRRTRAQPARPAIVRRLPYAGGQTAADHKSVARERRGGLFLRLVDLA